MAKLLQVESAKRTYRIGHKTHGYTIPIDQATLEALERIHATHGTFDMRIQDYLAAIVRSYAKKHDTVEE